MTASGCEITGKRGADFFHSTFCVQFYRKIPVLKSEKLIAAKTPGGEKKHIS